MVPLGGPPGETVKYSSARDVSADGVVIVGDIDATGFGSQTYRWTSETGMVPLGGRSASAVSADGSVVVGLGGPDAFRWTAQSGRIGLGDLPGGDFRSFANDVSADGSVIVGFGTTEIGDEAMFWTQETGMVNLRSFLTSQGLDLAGWTLTSVEGVSADGRTVVGSGVNPAGNQEAWIATIPEPSTIILALLAGAALLGTYLRELLRQRRALVAD
jgi:uncharacterized membrane protein